MYPCDLELSTPHTTVDVLLTTEQGSMKVLLMHGACEPFADASLFPCGFVRENANYPRNSGACRSRLRQRTASGSSGPNLCANWVSVALRYSHSPPIDDEEGVTAIREGRVTVEITGAELRPSGDVLKVGPSWFPSQSCWASNDGFEFDAIDEEEMMQERSKPFAGLLSGCAIALPFWVAVGIGVLVWLV